MIVPVQPAHQFSHNGVTVHVYHADRGQGLPQHEHVFNHVTMCNSGSFVVRKQNIEKICDKTTQPIDLKAMEWHEIEALEDGTVFVNIFSA